MTDHARETALTAAVRMHTPLTPSRRQHRTGETEILATADRFYAWLIQTPHLVLTEGPILSQSTGRPTGAVHKPGETMQLHDDEKFDLTVDTKDAKGFETADQIQWTVDDGSVVSLTVSQDGKICTVVAGSPGSAVITVTDSSQSPALTATEAVDVIAGDTTEIDLTEGDVSKQ